MVVPHCSKQEHTIHLIGESECTKYKMATSWKAIDREHPEADGRTHPSYSPF